MKLSLRGRFVRPNTISKATGPKASPKTVRAAFSLTVRALVVCSLPVLLSACSSQLGSESRVNLERSKGVRAALAPSPLAWSPEPRYLSLAGGHSAQILEIFPLQRMGSGGAPRVLSVDTDGLVLLWPLEENRSYLIYQLPHKVQHSAITQDGRILAVADGARVSLHSLPEQKELVVLDRLPTRVTAITYHPDGRSLLIGGADGNVYRWRFATFEDPQRPRDRNKSFERYLGHSSVVSGLAYHPYGRVFFSGDWKGKMRVWLAYDEDLYRGKYDKNIFAGDFFSERSPFRTISSEKKSRVDFIRVFPDGERFVVGTGTGEIELWGLRGLRVLAATEAHRGMLREVAVDKAGRQILTYGRDGMLRIWELVSSSDEVLGEEFYQLKLIREGSLPNIKRVTFVSNDYAVAGALDGKLFGIQLEKLMVPGVDRLRKNEQEPLRREKVVEEENVVL